ncbi:MAG: hypothetical protein JKX70_00265 [Phycisphaerales bacterium]|nr:hypothetical protein [Phycisphaerales bacterium]
MFITTMCLTYMRGWNYDMHILNTIVLWTTLISTSSLIAHSNASTLNDDPVGDPETQTETDDTDNLDDGGGGSAQSIDEQDFIEPWMYLTVPEDATYSLREVLTFGTPGWEAFGSSGYQLDEFEPIHVFAELPTLNNGGIVILMIVDRCLGDFNGNGMVDAGDIILFAHAYFAGDIEADLTRDGVIDFDDQSLFLELVRMGCVVI